MLSLYAEDILSQLYLLVCTNAISVQHQDVLPIQSFYSKISLAEPLTKNQANYITKLLDKYKNASADAGIDYRENIKALKWKLPFRELDLSKKIYVEEVEGKLEICIKFPYQLKKEFETEIETAQSTGNRKASTWDPENRIRRLEFYEFNLITLYEFAVKHNFEIDDSFMSVVSEVEEIWANADDIVPYSRWSFSGLELVNAPEDAENYYSEHTCSSYAKNLLLAKSMGYLYKGAETGTVEQIAAAPENTFWIKDYSMFFRIYNQLKERVCIILDRSSNTLEWLQNFVAEADRMLVSRDEIKVCFREGKDGKFGINEWIKLAGVGGKVETGKILIFESKPAKWLFKDPHDVTLLITNNIYPQTNVMTRDWFNSHPVVIYLGNTKPTEQRGYKIVEL